MDKLREEFEQWFSKKYPLKKPSVRKLKLWEAWRDSRASIVVELPNGLSTREALDLGYMGDYASGVDDGIEETAKVIRSIGLSIKGE